MSQSWISRYWSWISIFLRVVIDPRFTNSNLSSQKFVGITLVHVQTLLRRGHTTSFLIEDEKMRHPFCWQFSHSTCAFCRIKCSKFDLICLIVGSEFFDSIDRTVECRIFDIRSAAIGCRIFDIRSAISRMFDIQKSALRMSNIRHSMEANIGLKSNRTFCTPLFLILKHSCKMRNIRSVEIFTMALISEHHIMDFINHFLRNYLFWTSRTHSVICARRATTKFSNFGKTCYQSTTLWEVMDLSNGSR